MKSIIIFLTVALLSFDRPAVIDYREIFGNDYKWAVNWMKQNEQLFAGYATKYSIPAKELQSIVFPELIRYNRVFDALEIETLKFLYVGEGKEYADFSVGYFQMKPSFAEDIENDAELVFGYGAIVQDNDHSRRERIRRLTNTMQQLNYLCAFYKICERRFAAQKFSSASERLRIFATAYNSGYKLAYDKLAGMQSRKHFNGYNYADVSLFYYTH